MIQDFLSCDKKEKQKVETCALFFRLNAFDFAPFREREFGIGTTVEVRDEGNDIVIS